MTMIAGTAMIIWIFVQVALIGLISWMQPVFFIIGGLELILSYRLRLEKKNQIRSFND
jgi:uncharacterized membrane protein